MWEENLTQYGIVIAAIAMLLLIKSYILRKRVNTQFDQFVHPELCIEEVKTKVGSPQNALTTISVYVKNAEPTPDRIRNVALLIAYLNSVKKGPALKSQVLGYIEQVKESDITTKKYKNYIVQSIGDWR